MNMNQLLQSLLKLQAIEFGEIKEKKMEKQLGDLRTQIPAPILAHYDRFRAQGKKGMAAIRNQVCMGCHLQVPRATVINLMHGDDIQICGNCGRYLYLAESQDPQLPAPAPAVKSAAKSRKRRELTHAA